MESVTSNTFQTFKNTHSDIYDDPGTGVLRKNTLYINNIRTSQLIHIYEVRVCSNHYTIPTDYKGLKEYKRVDNQL